MTKRITRPSLREIQKNTTEVDRVWMLNQLDSRDRYLAGLRDLLAYYDRVSGNVPGSEVWTTADVLRIAEIRKMVKP